MILYFVNIFTAVLLLQIGVCVLNIYFKLLPPGNHGVMKSGDVP
jgi:hypothetical protein